MRPYKDVLAIGSLLEHCRTPLTSLDSPAVISGTNHIIDLRKLESVLSSVDREQLSEHRRKLNELYQEVKLEEEPGKGISFQSALVLLARYELIDEREALTYVIAIHSSGYGCQLIPDGKCAGLRNGRSGDAGKNRSLSCVGIAESRHRSALDSTKFAVILGNYEHCRAVLSGFVCRRRFQAARKQKQTVVL